MLDLQYYFIGFFIIFLFIVLLNYLLKCLHMKKMRKAVVTQCNEELITLLCEKSLSGDLTDRTKEEILKTIEAILISDIAHGIFNVYKLDVYDFLMLKEIPEICDIYFQYAKNDSERLYVLQLKQRLLSKNHLKTIESDKNE